MSDRTDLVGRRLRDEAGRVLTVVGFASWSDQYAELEEIPREGDVPSPFRTVRSVQLLRRYDGWL